MLCCFHRLYSSHGKPLIDTVQRASQRFYVTALSPALDAQTRAKRCLRNKEWANATPFYDACVTEQDVDCGLQEIVRSPSRNHGLTSARARVEL